MAFFDETLYGRDRDNDEMDDYGEGSAYDDNQEEEEDYDEEEEEEEEAGVAEEPGEPGEGEGVVTVIEEVEEVAEEKPARKPAPARKPPSRKGAKKAARAGGARKVMKVCLFCETRCAKPVSGGHISRSSLAVSRWKQIRETTPKTL